MARFTNQKSNADATNIMMTTSGMICSLLVAVTYGILQSKTGLMINNWLKSPVAGLISI